MKSFIVVAALLSSFAVSAAELTVMKVPAQKVRGTTTTRFEVNLQDGTAGVSLTASKRVMRGRGHRTISKTFEVVVPELALVDKTLVLTANGESVDCGTMGETRIFKRPVLLLSGNCDIITKKVGASVNVIVVTK